MTWQHVTVLLACLAAVISCGLHPGCVAVLPQIVTLVTFICGGVIGIIQGAVKQAKDTVSRSKPKEAPDVTNH